MNNMKRTQHLVFIWILLLVSSGCVASVDDSLSEVSAILPTATITAVPPTPTLQDTATPTYTPTLTPTPTYTPTPSNTPTSTPTFTPTNTPHPSITPTITPSSTPTPTPLPLPTPVGTISYTVKVPILMYHYVSTPPEDADVYRTDLSVEPEVLLEQMTYLAENGYTPIDFYDLSRAITTDQPLPSKPVILTFDDGYLDNYENAYPILEQFGFKATFFIVTEFVDRNLEGYMTWEMIAEMASAGHRFEPHSRTHPDLREQSRAFLIWEILGPIETLTYHLGYQPRYFSYPSGRYDEDVINILQELDMWGAVTTQSGKWHGYPNRYEWSRLRVRYNTPLAEFIDMVDPGEAINGKNPEDQ